MDADENENAVNEKIALKGRHSTAAVMSPFQGLVFFVLAPQG